MPKLSPDKFYETYYPIVKEAVKDSGIYPEVAMAQLAIESGWGAKMDLPGMPIFGVKNARGREGVTYDTPEVRGGRRAVESGEFESYDSVEEAIGGYVRFLKENSRYEEGGVFKAKSPEEQAQAIADAKYATSPTYGSAVMTTIKANRDRVKRVDTTYKPPSGETKSKAMPGKTEFVKWDLQRPKEFGQPGKRMAVLKDEKGKQFSIEVPAEYGTEKVGNETYFVGEPGELIDLPISSEDASNFDFEKAPRISGDEVVANQTEGLRKKFDEGTISEKEINELHGLLDSGLSVSENPSYDQYRGFPETPQGEVAKARENLNLFQGLPDARTELERRLTEAESKVKVGVTVPSSRSGDGGAMNVHDMDQLPGGVNAEDLDLNSPEADPNVIRERLNRNQELLSGLKRNEVDDSYAPDDKSGTDTAGYLIDAGRGLLGLKGALEDIPDYTPSKAFSTYQGEAATRRNMGLSDEEIGLRKQLAERGFGYDVKNIRRLAGGSAGVALGNLGRANQQLQDQYAGIAATDEGVRRDNRSLFYDAATRAETVNRQIFQDDRAIALANKESGAGLLSDALSNIGERRDFEKEYGQGSPYYEYMKELTLGQRSATSALNDANKQRADEYETDLRAGVAADTKLLGDLTGDRVSITGDEKPALLQQEPYSATGEEIEKSTGGQIDEPQAGNYDAVPGETQPPLVEGKTSTPPSQGQQGLFKTEEGGEEKTAAELTPEERKEAGVTKTALIDDQGNVVGDALGYAQKSDASPGDILRAKQSEGTNIQAEVFNSPEYKEKVAAVDTQFSSELKSAQDEVNKARDNEEYSYEDEKKAEKKLKAIEKKIAAEKEKLKKKQEAFVKTQFDESGKYIGE